MPAGEGVDDADGAEVIAFGKLVGGEGAVFAEPHAEFERIEFGREAQKGRFCLGRVGVLDL